MKTCHRAKVGETGEMLAAACLRREGYQILARNYRVPGGEIDLIASFQGLLVLIEVKTADLRGRPAGLWNPEDNISQHKRLLLERAALFCMNEWCTGREFKEARIDVMAVLLIGQDRARVRHYKNALAF
jgi:putative endonuclease